LYRQSQLAERPVRQARRVARAPGRCEQ